MTQKNNFLTAMALLVGVLVAVIVIFLVKKLIYRLAFKKKFYIFQVRNTKGIANMAMVIAVAVGALLILTMLTAGLLGIMFRAYPGTRAVVQNILVKIGGLFFGPIEGMFIGATTDLLCVFITGGVFHYGFFLCSVFYGALSGLIRFLFVSTKRNLFLTNLIISIVVGILLIGSFYYFSTNADGAGRYAFLILGLHMSMTKLQMDFFVGVFYLLIIAICWALTFVYYRRRFRFMNQHLLYSLKFLTHESKLKKDLIKNKQTQTIVLSHQKWFAKHSGGWLKMHSKLKDFSLSDKKITKQNWVSCLVIVMLATILCDGAASTFLLPLFDFNINPSLKLSSWIIFRETTLPIIFLVNLFILFPVYRMLTLIIRYN